MSEIQPIEPTAVYTSAEAAKVTRMSENTIRRLARRGDIRAARVGARVLRFLGSDLLTFLGDGGTEQPVNTKVDTVRRRVPRQVA